MCLLLALAACGPPTVTGPADAWRGGELEVPGVGTVTPPGGVWRVEHYLKAAPPARSAVVLRRVDRAGLERLTVIRLPPGRKTVWPWAPLDDLLDSTPFGVPAFFAAPPDPAPPDPAPPAGPAPVDAAARSIASTVGRMKPVLIKTFPRPTTGRGVTLKPR